MKSFSFIIVAVCAVNMVIAYLQESGFTDKCTKPGLMCHNCTNLVHCTQIDNNQFEMTDVKTCRPNETCLIDKCTSEKFNPRCSATFNFTCTATGTFPDPYDCQEYHICVKGQDANGKVVNDHNVMKCEDGYGYDPVSTYCKDILTNGCPMDKLPVPQCSHTGQEGVTRNPSIYYICTKSGGVRHPELHLCPHGQKYISGSCKA